MVEYTGFLLLLVTVMLPAVSVPDEWLLKLICNFAIIFLPDSSFEAKGVTQCGK
jgi:hypothetical protein